MSKDSREKDLSSELYINFIEQSNKISLTTSFFVFFKVFYFIFYNSFVPPFNLLINDYTAKINNIDIAPAITIVRTN